MSFMLQMVLAIAIGVVGGGYLASWGIAFIERVRRRYLGRPADPNYWVCRICNSRIKHINSVPLLGYMRTRGRCWDCGAQISFGLFIAELVGAVGGVLVSVMWATSPNVGSNMLLTVVCVLLFVCTLLQLAFGKIYWIPVGLLLIVICTSISSIAYMLISVCVVIVYKMIYEALFEHAVKQKTIKREDKANFDPGVVSRVDVLFDLVVFNLFGIFSMIAFVFMVNLISMCMRSLKIWTEMQGFGWLRRNVSRIEKSDKGGTQGDSLGEADSGAAEAAVTQGDSEAAKAASAAEDKDTSSNTKAEQAYSPSNGVFNRADKWGIKQSSPWVVYVTLAIYLIYGYNVFMQIMNW